MDANPAHSQEICQRLFSGYQFSPSDLRDLALEPLYTSLDRHFDWFQQQLALVGFTLRREDHILFLEKENKQLSDEEQRAIVVLFLLADLWMEKGHSLSDLFLLRVDWTALDWFRDGYGKEYLAQVRLEDTAAIEDLFRRIARKGLVAYYPETSTITLREPADRLINQARHIHRRLKETGEAADHAPL